MKPYILCFLLTFMLLIPPFDTAVSVTTISSLSGDKMKCGATAVIMCSIQPYSNIMTWQVNTDITAQCAFGCSDNPPFSGNYVFTFDETNGIFNVTLGPVLLSDDGKVFKCDNGLSSVDFVTPAVKVIPSNADATYTTTNTTSGVDVVLTTGCVYADNVVIKWYYSKVLNNPSPDVYMINTPGTVTVSDIACQSGNCGSNNVAKRRSTLSILTSTTGETYFFFIRVSSSDFDGDLLPVGSYMLKGTVTLTSSTTPTPSIAPITSTSLSTSTTPSTTTLRVSSTRPTTSTTTNSMSSTENKPEEDYNKTTAVITGSVVGGLFFIGISVTVVILLVRKFRKNQTMHKNSSKYPTGFSKKELKGRQLTRHPEHSEYISSHPQRFSANELYGYNMYSGRSEIKRNPLYSHHSDRRMNMSYVTNRGQYHYDQLYNGNQFLVYQMPSAGSDPQYTRRGHVRHPKHRYQYSTTLRALRTQDNTIVTDYSENWN